MPIDPLTSYEQAEAEADEKFYEEREDQESEESDDENYDAARDFERDKGDDDGVEYGDPRDEMEDRLWDL